MLNIYKLKSLEAGLRYNMQKVKNKEVLKLMNKRLWKIIRATRNCTAYLRPAFHRRTRNTIKTPYCPPETSPARIKDAAQPLIVLYDFTPPAWHNSVGPSIGHYYDSRDRDTSPVRTAVCDPLITFHLSGAMSAIYAWQASLTLLTPDEWAIDRAIRYDMYTGMALASLFWAVLPKFLLN